MTEAVGRIVHVDGRHRTDNLSQPPLSAMGVRLRPVSTADYGFIYGLETDPATAVRWRHRGATPSPERVIGTLFDGVVVLFVVERTDRSPVGFVVAFGADDRNGTCHIAMVGAPGRGVGVTAAMLLFINYLFSAFPFRKLYADAIEFNYRQFQSGLGRYFSIEGRLVDHEYADGRYWDKLILGFHRQAWTELRRSDPRLRRLLGLASAGQNRTPASQSLTRPATPMRPESPLA